jgi:ribosome-associated toxin RatA of RatAB toxin-antitoxin module
MLIMNMQQELLSLSPDADALLPLVNGGLHMAINENLHGKISSVTTASLVPVSQDRIWDVLTDFEHYQDFLPAIRRLKVRRRAQETIIVSEVGLKLMGMGGYATFKQRICREDPFLTLHDYDSRELTGFWKVMPVDDEETILLHHSIVTDPGEFMSFLRWLIRVFPPSEIALSVTPDVVMMQCMKKRIIHGA